MDEDVVEAADSGPVDAADVGPGDRADEAESTVDGFLYGMPVLRWWIAPSKESECPVPLIFTANPSFLALLGAEVDRLFVLSVELPIEYDDEGDMLGGVATIDAPVNGCVPSFDCAEEEVDVPFVAAPV